MQKNWVWMLMLQRMSNILRTLWMITSEEGFAGHYWNSKAEAAVLQLTSHSGERRLKVFLPRLACGCCVARLLELLLEERKESPRIGNNSCRNMSQNTTPMLGNYESEINGTVFYNVLLAFFRSYKKLSGNFSF
jgi:hypothetical protein